MIKCQSERARVVRHVRTTNRGLAYSLAIARFRGINDWGGGASMPKIPEEVIESIIYERPLSLLGIAPNADG